MYFALDLYNAYYMMYMFQYINKEPVMDTSGKRTIKYHEFHGDIEFKDVTFSYPTRPEAVTCLILYILFVYTNIMKLSCLFEHSKLRNYWSELINLLLL